MTEAAINLFFMALVGAVALAVALWPRLRHLRKAGRENRQLQEEHDRLIGQNRARAQRILEAWRPPEEAS